MLLYSRGQRYSSVLNEIIITKRQKRYKSTELFLYSFLFVFVFLLLLLLCLQREIKSRPSSVCCLFWLPMSVRVSGYYDYTIDTTTTTTIYYIYLTTMYDLSPGKGLRGFYITTHCGWAVCVSCSSSSSAALSFYAFLNN